MLVTRPLVLIVLTCTPVVVGCGSKKVVAPLREQKPGQVTYSNTGGGPVWTTTGSAKYTKSVAIGQAFDRKPHFTYVVFRDKQRNEDHVVTIEAAGDLTVTEHQIDVKGEACQFRTVEVAAVQEPVSASLKVRPVELLNLGAEGGPRIVVRSDGRVRLKYPSMWHLDDTFGLDEVRAVRHTRNLSGSGTIQFALVEKEYELSYPSGATAAEHYAELERVVKPLAPHVQLSTGRSGWQVALAVLLGVAVLACVIAAVAAAVKSAKK